MNCSNSLCTKPKDNSQPLPFTCDYCKENKYCSKVCQVEDWNTGHSLICQNIHDANLKKAEETCPFIKSGKFLSDGEANSLAPKSENIYTNYEPFRGAGNSSRLGKGSYGEVILMRHKITGQLVAMKIIEKGAIGNPTVLKSLVNEIEIQKRIVHENIIRLFSHVEDHKNIYIIMEYASKGTLFQLIRRKGKLSQKEAFFFFTQACSAVHFLHTHKLMHRDIKPENLLVTERGILKLCDFGCCTHCDSNDRMTFCGTIEYMAPEIVKREGYGEKADIWSLGVLLYELLHGYAPFHGRRDQETVSMIIENKIGFGEIPEDAKDLVRTMMKEDPKQRPEAWEIFLHLWMKRMQKEFGISEAKAKENNSISNEGKKSESDAGGILSPTNSLLDVKKGPIARSLIYNPKRVSAQDLPRTPPAPSCIAARNKDSPEESKKNDNAIPEERPSAPLPIPETFTPKSLKRNPLLSPKKVGNAPVSPTDFKPNSLPEEVVPEKVEIMAFSLPEDVLPDKPKIQPQVSQILSSKPSVTQSTNNLYEAFASYRGSSRPSKKTRNAPAPPTQGDKDNIFHRDNRRSTWSNLGFPTFKFEPEEDPLFHVNKFLEEVSHEPKIKWQDALGEYKEDIRDLHSELQKKLLGCERKEEGESDSNLDNTSYTSDDYAFQRSETVMKAVNYLDDIDADPTMKSSRETAQEIWNENERLKRVCGKVKHSGAGKGKKQQSAESPQPKSSSKPEELKDDTRIKADIDFNENDRSKEKPVIPLLPLREEEEKAEAERALTKVADKSNASPSEYKGSIDKIVWTLLKMKHDDTKFYQKKTQVANVSRKSAKPVVSNSSPDSKSIWNQLFSFSGKGEL